MEWLTWFPSFYWQHWAFAAALIVVVIAMIMAIRPRSRRPKKPI